MPLRTPASSSERWLGYRREFGVRILDVHLQWTLAHKGYPSRLAPLKTV
jgi:hypothetical protein